jgi:EAL domain-containing protein (putative c-di-GMP-specific phosphodiesterase class I)
MVTADEVVAALKDDRILLAYQPIVSAKGSRTAVHHESLVRMAKRDGTIVSAGNFIPAAEQLGLVRLVDRRALELAVAELHANTQISLAVNVSGTSAADSSWLRGFLDYVRTNKSAAPRLIVELTETAAFNHFELNAQFISQLAGLGCRVAIDDFGAGYTSFRNLQMLKVDMVKIDGAYVKDLCASPENQVFVRTLVGLARNFNLRTVAEWVNSEDEANLLEGFGVDYFQGYFFGPPTLTPSWRARAGN